MPGSQFDLPEMNVDLRASWRAKLPHGGSRSVPESYIHHITNPSLYLSNYAQEEEKLRKLYDQARAQGNRKKKKEYREKLAELNRLRKYSQDEDEESKD